MPRIARVCLCSYHITQRGNRREDVFFNEADRAAYLAWLGEYCVAGDRDIRVRVRDMRCVSRIPS